jgi:hypothetical protein
LKEFVRDRRRAGLGDIPRPLEPVNLNKGGATAEAE